MQHLAAVGNSGLMSGLRITYGLEPIRPGPISSAPDNVKLGAVNLEKSETAGGYRLVSCNRWSLREEMMSVSNHVVIMEFNIKMDNTNGLLCNLTIIFWETKIHNSGYMLFYLYCESLKMVLFHSQL